MKVHIVIKHDIHPYNPRLVSASGEVKGVFSDKNAAEQLANEKDSKLHLPIWNVHTKVLKTTAQAAQGGEA